MVTRVSECNKYPDKCPITNLPFFMELEHPNIGIVPTYGGPYDSYTIPEVDEEGDFIRYRYDHDEGCWVDGIESIGEAFDMVQTLQKRNYELQAANGVMREALKPFAWFGEKAKEFIPNPNKPDDWSIKTDRIKFVNAYKALAGAGEDKP